MAGLRASQNLVLTVGNGDALRSSQSLALFPANGEALRASWVAVLLPRVTGTQVCPEDPPGHPQARLQYHYEELEKGFHDFAIVIQQLMRGESNNSGCFCLDENADTTTVQDMRVGARGEQFSTCARGAHAFTVHHANNSEVRCFDYVIYDDAIFLTPINSGGATEIGNGTIFIPDG